MIKIKIDVTKITKEKLFKGQKGTYLNAVLIETPQSQYSDYMIVEESTIEEREAGNKGTIIGNASTIVKKQPEPTTEPQPANVNGLDEMPGDDLPF